MTKNNTNDTKHAGTDNNDDVVISASMWDNIDAMLADAGSPLHWLQGEAHDSYSDAVIAIDNARAAVKAARNEYNSKHASK